MMNIFFRVLATLWLIVVSTSFALAQPVAQPRKLIPFPEVSPSPQRAIVTIYNVSNDGSLQPVSLGFFITPWTVVTSHQRLQAAGNNGALRLTLKTLDGQTNYRPLFFDLVDKDKDWVKIETRERSDDFFSPAESERLKAGEKVFLLTQGNASDKVSLFLSETTAPLSQDLISVPLFNEKGQLIGMGIDPTAKDFANTGMLAGKALSKLHREYIPAYKNGKLVCLARMECSAPDKSAAKDNPQSTIAQNLDEAKIVQTADLANIEKQASISIGEADYPRLLKGYVLRKVAAEYPPIAKSIRAAGSVLIRVVYGENGEVIFAQPLSGHQLLVRPALEAARQWVFEPTVLEGRKVRVEGILTLKFTLM